MELQANSECMWQLEFRNVILICAMVKSRYIGDGHTTTFNRNPYNGYIKSYYWVDEFIPYYLEIPGVDRPDCTYITMYTSKMGPLPVKRQVVAPFIGVSNTTYPLISPFIEVITDCIYNYIYQHHLRGANMTPRVG